MRYVSLIAVVYLTAVAQTTLVDVLEIGSVVPDMLALTAVVWMLLVPSPRAFLVAGLVVLIGDAIAPGRIGLGAAWMLLVGYGVVRWPSRQMTEHLAGQVALVWAAVSLWALGTAASGCLLGQVDVPWLTALARALGVGVYTAAVALPVLMVVGWIREPILKRRRQLAEF